MRRMTVCLLMAVLGCGGGGDGADAAPAGDGTAGADGAATADAPPGGGGAALVNEALVTCAWTTGCLNPEDNFGGGAPNTNMSSCIATFMDQRAQPFGEAMAPWAQYRACTATATDCATLITCLEGNSAICGATGDWRRGAECGDGTRTCDGACLGTCEGVTTACSGSGDRVEICDGNNERFTTCDGGECVEFGGGAQCLPGQTGSCGADAATCDGTTLVACFAGIENRFDCASAGQTCLPGSACQDGDACDYMHEDTCAGTVLTVCASGNVTTLDCATLGATCGTTSAGRAGCRWE